MPYSTFRGTASSRSPRSSSHRNSKAMVDDLLSGARTSLEGPFNVLLRSPEMGNLSQKLGEYLRFRTVVPEAAQRDGHSDDGQVVVVSI